MDGLPEGRDSRGVGKMTAAKLDEVLVKVRELFV